MATRLFLHSDVQQKVKARLGLDQQLWFFASNLTALDAHFFSAAELLLQQEGQLVQQAAQLLGAGGWNFQVRHPNQRPAPDPVLVPGEREPGAFGRAAQASTAAAGGQHSAGPYRQPTAQMLGSSCGWVGLYMAQPTSAA